MSARIRKQGLQLLKIATGVVVTGAVWEIACRVFRVPAYLFPSLHDVLAVFLSQWQVVLANSIVTLNETLLGFAIAFVAGLAVAILLNASERLSAILWPSILFAQIVPKVAIAPFLLLWLGFGISSKVVIAALIAFFPILANSYAGFRSVDQDMLELARSMKAGRGVFFFRFQLPQALPHILGGMRIAIAFSVVGTVVAEFIGADRGLGYLVVLSARLLKSDLMFCAILVLGAMGLVLYGLAGLAERWIIPWHISQRRAGNDDRRHSSLGSEAH